MKHRMAMFLLIALSAPAAPVAAQQTVVVVRHGEKLDNSKDPPLSPVGEARARRLADMLKASGVKAIYTSEYRRTRELAAPLATALGIAPVAVAGAGVDAVIARIRAHGEGDTVLVVGHSNTVPQILAGLGYKGEVRVDDSEYDNLFLLVPRPGAAPTLVRLKY